MSPETYAEKVSVNINTSTLSSIDLLVDNGYYSNRSDFINQAVRAELQRQQSVVDHIVRRNEQKAESDGSWFIGIYGILAKDVEEMYRNGEQVDVKGYGLLIINEDCDREKLFQAIKSINVRGRVKAANDIKEHYGIK